MKGLHPDPKQNNQELCRGSAGHAVSCEELLKDLTMVDRQGGAVVPTDTWGRLGHSELAMKGTQAIKEKDLEALLGGMCAYYNQPEGPTSGSSTNT